MPPRTPARRTPREYLAAIFDAVLEEAERNPDFAERLGEKLEGDLTVVFKPPRKTPPVAPPELLELDLKAARAELGQIDLREKIAAHKNGELAAYIRAKGLTDEPVGKKNKTQLVNIIMRASR